METLLLFVLVVVTGVLLTPYAIPRAHPLAARLRLPLVWPGGGRSDLGPLIQALYNDLMSPSRLTFFSRRYVIGARRWRIVAHPDDAAVLKPLLHAVEEDLNFALKRSTRRDRLVVQLPLELVSVTVDEDMPVGRPRMEPLADAAASPRTGHRTEPTRPFPTPDETIERPLRTQRPAADEEPGKPRLTLLWPLGRDTPPIAIPAEGMTLGRDPALADMQVDAKTVSWRHAALKPSDGGWRIVDLGSRNGTFVSGRRVREEQLKHGDVIGLGRKVTFRFVADDVPFRETVRAEGDVLP